jgi:hypothetical protein
MRKLLGVVMGVFVPAVFLISPAGAMGQAPTGDTCTASGSGTSYTLSITLPPTASPQGGFAFGARGVKVTNIDISGDTGSLSTQNLPPNTTGQWLMSNTPRPGESVTAVLTTSGPVTGSFRVIAASSPPSSGFFAQFLCPVSHGTAVPGNVFTVDQHVTYNSVAGAWHLLVTVPGPGTVTGIQAVASAAGSKSKPRPSKYLIQARGVVATSAGKFTLTLRPTAGGNAALKKSGSIKLTMTVAFNPKDGKSAAKVVSLTLKK